jgi:hypothetical protein
LEDSPQITRLRLESYGGQAADRTDEEKDAHETRGNPCFEKIAVSLAPRETPDVIR